MILFFERLTGFKITLFSMQITLPTKDSDDGIFTHQLVQLLEA